jgi:hypothetical protein
MLLFITVASHEYECLTIIKSDISYTLHNSIPEPVELVISGDSFSIKHNQ